MKPNISILLYILVIFPVSILGQKTSITFRSNTETTIRVNKPIDGLYNFYFVSEKFELKPNICINYELDLRDFGFLRCVYSNGNIVYILVQDGDHIEIENRNNKIFFKGDNAAGNQYFVDNYSNKGLGFYYTKVDSILKRSITTKIDFKAINKDFQDSIVKFYLADIKKLKSKKLITERYATNMSRNLMNAYNAMLFNAYRNVLWGKINEYKPSTSEKNEIINRLDQLCYESLKDGDVFKYIYKFSFQDYYFLKYKALDADAKAKLTDKCDTDTFGTYIPLLLAPENIKLGLFKENMAYQLTYQTNCFDSDKMLKFLTIRQPESEYLPVFKEFLKKRINKRIITRDSLATTVIDGKNISSIKELLQVDGIKGKNLYIDLWATWCSPCKFQFQYNEDLHKLISQYDNLTVLYLSIDEAKNEETWKSQIESFHLSGYNLRASNSLLNDIRQKIYEGKDLFVPRYVLLDATGKILNSNLPKPQTIDSLSKVLSKELTIK